MIRFHCILVFITLLVSPGVAESQARPYLIVTKYADGTVVEGMYYAGSKHGLHIESRADGTVNETFWQNGVRVDRVPEGYERILDPVEFERQSATLEVGATLETEANTNPFGGIGRAIAGIATGAGIAAAVTEGVPPEDAVEFGMQVLGTIADEPPATRSVGPNSGAAIPSLPSSTSASPVQSSSSGQCEIPGFYDGEVMDEALIENVRLSWCPIVASISQRRIFALYAESAWCRLNAEPPPANMTEYLQASRQTCASLAALDEQARTATGPVFGEAPARYVRCRCPAHYFQ